MMVKMHSQFQNKPHTTKHIQMRACILSHNLLELLILERIARATQTQCKYRCSLKVVERRKRKKEATAQGNKNQCTLEITSNDDNEKEKEKTTTANKSAINQIECDVRERVRAQKRVRRER